MRLAPVPSVPSNPPFDPLVVIEVAVAAPRVGVTKVGESENTALLVPVSSVNAEAKFAEDGVARNVNTPVPAPVNPLTGAAAAVIEVLHPNPVFVVQMAALAAVEQEVIARAVGEADPEVAFPTTVLVAWESSPERGNPVAFVSVPLVGVPKIGVVKVGDVANTSRPEPVSFVTAVARFAEDGVPRNVAIPVASPLTPVEIGRPVAFVKVPLVGIPRIGATRVTVVPSVVHPDTPPKDPALLYWH